MIQTLDEFAELTGGSLPALDRLSKETHRYYKSWSVAKRDTSGKPKRTANGKVKARRIDAPYGELKKVQQAIKVKILDKIDLPITVYGIKKKGHISNANTHKGKHYHFHTDIRNFYPSISAKPIYRELRYLGFVAPVARLLRDLVTYGGRLTQGAPTSPMIANIVMRPIDEKLARLASEYDLAYTRYVDNITFSGSSDFQFLGDRIVSIIEEHGFRRNHEETFYKKGPVPITGPIVKQNILDVGNEIRNRAKDPNRSEASRRGYSNYIEQVKNESRRKRG